MHWLISFHGGAATFASLRTCKLPFGPSRQGTRLLPIKSVKTAKYIARKKKSMASSAGNVDVIVNVGEKDAPNCPHGPTLLFSKYDIQSGEEKRYFACSAFRDRKECPFFQWENEKISSEALTARDSYIKTKQPQFSHRQFRKRFHQVKNLKKEERYLCVDCGLLLLPGEVCAHEGQGHITKRSLTKRMLRSPTELFAPLDNNKTYAQYLFTESTSEFILDTLKRLCFSHVLCVGCPRVHEAILAKAKTQCNQILTSLLLDLDHRYLQVYPPQKFCRYNMLNHHFFSGDKSQDVFERFITEDAGKKVAMVMDPPFGGMVEALSATVNKIEKTWQKVSGFSSEKHLPVFWFFPYFMERRIIECCPTFSMLDYKVNYDNHVLFTSNKGRKQGSPVRIFTNIPPAEIVLPADQGYWYCTKCEQYSSKENRHCDICDSCTTKDGRTYVHCDRCSRCVKPSRVHCYKCNVCDLPGHLCGQVKSTGCHICGELDHKRRDCPNKNNRSSPDVLNRGVKRKKNKQMKNGKRRK